MDGLEQNARTGRTLDMYKGIDQKRANFASDGRGPRMLMVDEARN